MCFLDYQKSLNEFSRHLTQQFHPSEVLLWNELKAAKRLVYKFNRQKQLGNYIVDFYCSKPSLVIEVDGYSHESEEGLIKDAERQKILEEFDLNFFRVDDLDIKFDQCNVLMEIETISLNWQDQKAKNLQNPPAPFDKGESLRQNFTMRETLQLYRSSDVKSKMNGGCCRKTIPEFCSS